MKPSFLETAQPDAGPSRYQFAILEIVKSHNLWIAESEQHTLTLFDQDEQELLPIWPTSALALRVLEKLNGKEVYRPEKIKLKRWLSHSTKILIEKNMLVGVSPNETLSCPNVLPQIFAKHLNSAIAGMYLQSTDLRQLQVKVARKFKKSGQ